MIEVALFVTSRLHALKRPGERMWFEGKSTVKMASSELCCAAGGSIPPHLLSAILEAHERKPLALTGSLGGLVDVGRLPDMDEVVPH